MSHDEAKLWEATRLVLSHIAGAPGPTCDELWPEFWKTEASTLKTAARSDLAWRTARPFIGHLIASQVTEADIEKFKQARKEKAKIGTVNRDLIVIRRLFRWALERRKIPRMPVVTLEKYHVVRQTKLRSEKEIQRLLWYCSPLLQALVLVLVDGGLRREEALSLRREQVERKPDGGAVVRLPKTKNGRPRRPHITKRAMEALDALPVVCEFYFANPKTKRRFNARHISRMFDRAVLKSGLKGVDGEKITLHTLRHSFAYLRRVRDRWPESRVMAAGGWVTDVAFRRYGIVDDEELGEYQVGVEQRIRRELQPEAAPLKTDLGENANVLTDGDLSDE